MSRVYERVPVDVRFWRQVQRGSFGECWPFLGEARTGTRLQYGSFGLNSGELECGPKRGPRLAHRVAFRLVHGRWPVPQALHGCDNPLCCNAENLEHVHEGTAAQNMAELSSRCRGATQYGPGSELEVLLLMQKGTPQVEIARQLDMYRDTPAQLAFRALARRPDVIELLLGRIGG